MTAILETSLDIVKDSSIDKYYFTMSRWQIKRQLKLFILHLSKKSHKKNRDFKKMDSEFKKY